MRLKFILLVCTLFTALTMLDTSISHNRSIKHSGDSAILALAGEFRTVFANLLWIKAENYHHEFIAHQGDWTRNTDLLGLDRLITKLDPHFEEAYAAGSRMLIASGSFSQAREFLEEGIRNNPNSMMLHDELGTFLARHVKDYKSALYHLKRAYCLATDDWDKRRLSRLIKTVEEMENQSH